MSKISTVNHDIIRKHPANNSPAKIAYQFSKTKRFLDMNPEYLIFYFRCPEAHYNHVSQLSKRKTNFGYGNKTDFTKALTVSPRSSLYEKRSFIEENKKKNRGHLFNVGREKLKDRSYLIPQLEKVPGPGQVF